MWGTGESICVGFCLICLVLVVVITIVLVWDFILSEMDIMMINAQ